jgi:hypothetical protein
MPRFDRKTTKKLFVLNNAAEDSDNDLLIEFGTDAPSQAYHLNLS